MTGYWSTKSKSTSRVILSVVVSLLLALLLFNLVTADGVKHDASESGFKHTFNKLKEDSNVLSESELREKCDRVGEEGLNEQGQGWRKSDLSNGYPVQIVDIGKGTLQLKEEELKKILMQPSLENKRVMVLSIAGVFRSGKSFLLSLLIRYLTQGGSQSWLDEQESILEGFEWRSGSKRVTSGIWVWSKVFFIGPNHNKIGVVLMDTQGTQDPYTSTKENAAVFALSTLLSSVQIYNVKTDINEADLQFLELFIRYGIVIKDYNADNKPFQTLFFLIRDWPYADESNYGKDGGMEHLSKCMATSPMQSQENIDLRQSIYEVFTNMMCFLMPHPGIKIALGKTNGHLRDIDEEFQEQTKNLVKVLFSSQISEVKRIDGKDMTCGSLVEYFKGYVRTINEGECDITSIAEAHAMARDRKSYIDVMSDFDMKMDKLCEEYQENLKDIHVVMNKQALEYFKEKCGLNPSKKYEELEVIMEKNIDAKMQTYYTKNNLIEAEAKLYNHKLLTDALKRFETGMDEKCLSYMKASVLISEFQERKKQYLGHFRKNGKEIGQSYSKYIKQLEEDITKTYSVYTAKMEHFKNKAYLAAITAYNTMMDQIYKEYQYSENCVDNHEKAREKALQVYKEHGVGEMPKTVRQDLEESMRNKRDECEKLNIQNNENAEKVNTAAHDNALTFYRDRINQGHQNTKRKAENEYEQNAVRGFPSYEENKKHLPKAIEDLYKEYQSSKNKKGGGNGFLDTVGKVIAIVRSLFSFF